MPYEIEDDGDVVRTAHITVPAEEFQSRVHDALQELAEEVDVSGFREGQVPFSMIERRYGDRVRPQVIERLIREHIEEVAEEYRDRLLHVGETEVEHVPTGEEGDLEFTVDFELQPELDPIGYLGIQVEKPEPEVTDEEVDARLEEMQEEFATLEPIELRDTIREGDVVTFDFEPTRDDDALQEFTGEDIQTEIGSGQVLPAIEEGLEGADFRSTIEIDIDAGEDFPVDELRGQEIPLTIDIKTVKQKVLPELDDEFAKDTGEAQTLLELRSQIREELEAQKEHRAKHIAQENLVDELLESHEIEIPPSFLEQQVEDQLERQREMFEQQGLDPDQLGAHSDEFLEETRENVARNLKSEFLLLAIAEKEGLEVEEEDLDAFFEHQAQHDDRFSAEQLKQVMRQNDEQWENIQYQALLDKTKDYLLDDAEFETVPWPDDDAAVSSETSDETESDDDSVDEEETSAEATDDEALDS